MRDFQRRRRFGERDQWRKRWWGGLGLAEKREARGGRCVGNEFELRDADASL